MAHLTVTSRLYEGRLEIKCSRGIFYRRPVDLQRNSENPDIIAATSAARLVVEGGLAPQSYEKLKTNYPVY